MEETEYDCGYSQRKKQNMTGYSQWKKQNMTVATPNGRNRISWLWLLPMEETEYDCGYSQWKKQNIMTVTTPNRRECDCGYS